MLIRPCVPEIYRVEDYTVITGNLKLQNGYKILVKMYIPEKTKRCLPLGFGTVVPWTIDQKCDVAIFDIYLGSRIMRLTMLGIDKNL